MEDCMSKSICVLALSIVFAFSAVASWGQGWSGCNSETIKGDYAVRVSGQIFVPPTPSNPLPVIANYRDGIGLVHFDGKNGLSQVDYVVANGAVVPGPPDGNGFHNDETGTYTVNENCTGSAEINFPTPPGGTSGAVIKVLFVISDDGRQINEIVTSLTPPNSTTPVLANIHADLRRVHNDLW
jgi:hypothetical protein